MKKERCLLGEREGQWKIICLKLQTVSTLCRVHRRDELREHLKE
jgi:hypothetical protein